MRSHLHYLLSRIYLMILELRVGRVDFTVDRVFYLCSYECYGEKLVFPFGSTVLFWHYAYVVKKITGFRLIVSLISTALFPIDRAGRYWPSPLHCLSRSYGVMGIPGGQRGRKRSRAGQLRLEV